MSAELVSLKHARVPALLLSFAFGVAGFATGINALVKSDHQKRAIRSVAPAGATVNIDTSDVFAVGCVVTAVCGAIAVASAAFFLLLIFAKPYLGSPVPFSTRTLRFQSHILLFLTIGLFACLVPFTDFVANREANVTAFIGTLQLPQVIIQNVEQSLGLTSVYHRIGYLRLATIIPWITFLLSAISTGLSYAAARHARKAVDLRTENSLNGSIKEKIEGDVKQREVV
ncbi:hypothetical protein A0H81_02248 [Grifola frondosa]|uniref:Transmembrane protein n=1 Tax=Grifola frondosa TaxID=5627 RepID=A0A1C7MNE0_GRIFR|nr:hypothetical protein A0H81_02248 [Grifola frondosa]